MKKTLSFLVVLIAISLMSCNKDKDNQSESKIAGTWKLIYTNGSFDQPSYSFTPGVITWTFNPNTGILNIINNNNDENMLDIEDTGNYNYQITTDSSSSSCGEVFSFNLYNDMCIYIDSNNHLIINQNYPDGMRLEFIR